jgi:hypothetical protein
MAPTAPTVASEAGESNKFTNAWTVGLVAARSMLTYE